MKKTKEQEEYLNHLRHSAAHLLAAAVMEMWPNAKRTIGPAIEDGFYYDFEFPEPISENALLKIEKRMRKILPTWKGFERKEITVEEALGAFEGNEYKEELIEEFSGEGKTLTSYTSGKFTDLCRGGHVENPSQELKHFKLLSLAGAYWRGDEKNTMLTRIYGTAFPTQEELDAFVLQREEAKKRDHRKLGRELGLFTFSEKVGSGLPLFTSRGTILREELQKFVQELQTPYGYERVWIPHLAKRDLYETSGHWEKFTDDLFHVRSKKTDDEFVLKPMNCPHHTQIYASEQRSYRDLPIRMGEVTTVYRDENTGQLQGLSRVRSITQDDAHVFCREDQIEEEVEKIIEIITKFYAAFGMELSVELSKHDPAHPEKYLGDAGRWEMTEGALRNVLKNKGWDFEEVEGEAAFYGPKIDFKAKDAIGRIWQLATVQLDYNLPERFGLEYMNEKGEKTRPVMVHRAILGSIERFIGVMIEHFAGAFPVWLAPVQIAILPVGEGHIAHSQALAQEFRSRGFRVSADITNETVGNKIRKSEKMKIPYMLVIGDQEMQSEHFHVRLRGEKDVREMSKEEFIEKVKREILDRR